MSKGEIGFVFWITLLSCIILILRYLFYKLSYKNKDNLETIRLEMMGIIKWTGIISSVSFIILSAIAIVYVVFGSNFSDFFKCNNEVDMEEMSYIFTYRSMFFVGVISLAIYFLLGGKLYNILSLDFIDEDLRKK